MHFFNKIFMLCRPNQSMDLTQAPFSSPIFIKVTKVENFRSAADPPAEVVTEP